MCFSQCSHTADKERGLGQRKQKRFVLSNQKPLRHCQQIETTNKYPQCNVYRVFHIARINYFVCGIYKRHDPVTLTIGRKYARDIWPPTIVLTQLSHSGYKFETPPVSPTKLAGTLIYTWHAFSRYRIAGDVVRHMCHFYSPKNITGVIYIFAIYVGLML